VLQRPTRTQCVTPAASFVSHMQPSRLEACRLARKTPGRAVPWLVWHALGSPRPQVIWRSIKHPGLTTGMGPVRSGQDCRLCLCERHWMCIGPQYCRLWVHVSSIKLQLDSGEWRTRRISDLACTVMVASPCQPLTPTEQIDPSTQHWALQSTGM
jgi:hypothetical protein